METLEIHQTPKPSDSVDFHQTLGVSSPYSPSPNQILDDPSESTSVPAELSLDDFTNQISPSPNRSVSVLFIDDEDEGEGDEGDDGPSVNSPVNTFSAFSSSHWAEPWSLPGDRKTKPAEPESETELWSLSVDTSKPYEFNWSDDWTWCDETESKRSMVVAGLSNLGNTCFLNAILQCFTHTVQLIQGLLSCNHVPCDRYRDGFCILCAFRDHIEVAPTTGIVYPRRFVENLNYFSSGFRRFQQEDAHEFLQCFLDRLENCCNSLKTKDTTSSSQDDNFVKKGFGGRLVSKLRCCNCYHCSNTYEPSIDLSLEIEDVSTLQSALESFTKVEKLEDTDIKFTCENCNEEVSVEKQLMLEEAPLVAALHLKRFKNDGAFVEKIDKDVEFPLELDLGPYTCGSLSDDVELKYDLYAVVVHIGYSSTSGHYYCFIRYAPDTWYKFDDSKVTRVREDYVLSQEAYILFYAKQGTPWFSNFLMETQNPSFEPNTSNTSPKSVLDNADRVSTSSSNLPDNHNSCDVDQTSDASNEISREAFKGSRPDRFEGIEAKDDSQRIIGPLPLRESNSFYGTSFKVEKMFSPSNREFREAKDNSNFTLLTPPRSPSPDIPEEDPAEVGFYNTRNRVRSVDQVNSKRQANKEMDPERKQACKLLKTLPSSRSSQLLAAMRGSLSEGSVNKTKSRRSELSPRTADNSPSSARKNPKFSFIPRPLTASSFR